MSCYTCFFVRVDDSFARLGAYSRNNTIARASEEAHVIVPWEKITNVTNEMISEVREYTRRMIQNDKDFINKYEKEIDLIKSIPEIPLDEKLEKISDINSYIEEIKEDIEEWTYADNFFCFLGNAMDDAECEGQDEEHYIYWGLDISSPTINDIV